MDLISSMLAGYKPIIVVIHLPPTPASPRGLTVDYVVDYAVKEARIAAEAGADAVLLENYADRPYTIEADELVTATMAVAVRETRRETGLPVGVSVLRLGWRAALAAALAGDASFIRVNSYCEARVSPEGILYPAAAELERLRTRLARRIAVLADINVKHSLPIGQGYSVEEVIRDCLERGLADAIVVTATRTGQPPAPGYVAAVKSLASTLPVIVGSGISANNIGVYWDVADGFIVGSSIKVKGKARHSIDKKALQALVEQAAKLRKRARTA